MARVRNYRAEYERRKAKAISEGFKGYGQKRYRLFKQKQQTQATFDNEGKRRRVRDLIRGFYPDDMFDESGWLDRDSTDKEIKRALRKIEQRHGVHLDDATVNALLFDEATRWRHFRDWYEKMMGWAV